MTAEQLKEELLKADHAELVDAYLKLATEKREVDQDLKLTTVSVMKLLKILGLINQNNELNEDKTAVVHALGKLTQKALLGGKSITRDFAFLKDLIELFPKYKHLLDEPAELQQ